MDKKFRFTFETIRTNTPLNDSQVVEYEFIALGINPCRINNTITIRAGSTLPRWKENINQNEKTGANNNYVLTFDDSDDPDNAVQVISKIMVA